MGVECWTSGWPGLFRKPELLGHPRSAALGCQASFLADAPWGRSSILILRGNGRGRVLRKRSFWGSKGRWFPLRVAAAYLTVPLTAPALLILDMMRATRNMTVWDWVGIHLLYSIFCFAAMVVLGTPVLLLYALLRWSGVFAFVAGGAACAAATYTLVARGQTRTDQLVLFTLFGVVEGLVLRPILFGVTLRPRSTT